MKIIAIVFVCFCFCGCEYVFENNVIVQDERYAEYLKVQKYNKDMCMKSSGTIVLAVWDWSFKECKK
jgi:hypothetical protein